MQPDTPTYTITNSLREDLAHAITTAQGCRHPGSDTCLQWWQADAALRIFVTAIRSTAAITIVAEDLERQLSDDLPSAWSRDDFGVVAHYALNALADRICEETNRA